MEIIVLFSFFFFLNHLFFFLLLKYRINYTEGVKIQTKHLFVFCFFLSKWYTKQLDIEYSSYRSGGTQPLLYRPWWPRLGGWGVRPWESQRSWRKLTNAWTPDPTTREQEDLGTLRWKVQVGHDCSTHTHTHYIETPPSSPLVHWLTTLVPPIPKPSPPLTPSTGLPLFLLFFFFHFCTKSLAHFTQYSFFFITATSTCRNHLR